jgi:hypothetical protein
VYTGEHFVIDVLLGWMYATVVFVVGNRLFDAYEIRRAARTRLRLARSDAMVPA